MNADKLRAAAEELERELDKNCTSRHDISVLRRSLMPLIILAKSGGLSEAINWKDVPGDGFFDEGELRDYPELESAYANFKFQIAGVEPAGLGFLRR